MRDLYIIGRMNDRVNGERANDRDEKGRKE